MNGLTPVEQDRAIERGGPGLGICLALAELELYWENHRRRANAPDVHELRMNIRMADDGSAEDRIAAVRGIADWLGVEMKYRHGCYIAQRRFGSGADSLIVEAHFTPDATQAVIERQDAARKAELAGVAA